SDILREGEIRIPAALVLRRFQPVIEDAADAAGLAAMRQVEILVAPFLVTTVIRDPCMLLADETHRLVEGDRVGIVLAAPPVEDWRQVGATAEPLPRGDHYAGIHVDGGNM